ncbi:hypothetical protein [Roseobacter sp. CCS2]|uniref:hypothetical protein n=1 Tax=Roseobacter sp. CCS2 TaxID=391593 RepID=UPI0000F3E28E|nr:hypothetical protein [Roseobacter sp. CCS2]EBA12500.1 hypothetical protein RCCS2_14424 [Roseobacter sp. CCS2]
MPQYPFEYCIHCKRNSAARWSFLVDNLGDDLLIILVAFALVLEAPVWGVVGISLLHISFWMIYEVGYYENDLISATVETESRTPPGFAAFRDTFSEPVSWVYAAVFGAAGIWAISQSVDWHFMGMQTTGVAMAAVIWVVVLITLRLTYWAYSRIDKVSRVFLYLPLQVLKYGFPIGFVTLTPAGAALLLAQILRRWVPYIVYRYTGVLHSGLPIRALRLVIFVTGWVLLLPSNFADPAHYILGFVATVLLSLRAFTQFSTVINSAKSVRSDTWASKNS